MCSVCVYFSSPSSSASHTWRHFRPRQLRHLSKLDAFISSPFLHLLGLLLNILFSKSRNLGGLTFSVYHVAVIFFVALLSLPNLLLPPLSSLWRGFLSANSKDDMHGRVVVAGRRDACAPVLPLFVWFLRFALFFSSSSFTSPSSSFVCCRTYDEFVDGWLSVWRGQPWWWSFPLLFFFVLEHHPSSWLVLSGHFLSFLRLGHRRRRRRRHAACFLLLLYSRLFITVSPHLPILLVSFSPSTKAKPPAGHLVAVTGSTECCDGGGWP